MGKIEKKVDPFQYYLETNSLRQLNVKLDKQFLINHAYTSVLSLIEIASGIVDEDSFRIRKSVLKNVFDSKITICLALPETLFFKSFGYDYDDHNLINGIGRVFIQIIKSDTFQDFKVNIKKSKDYDIYEFILYYDQHGASLFKNLFNDQINKARKNSSFKELIKSFKSRWSCTDVRVASEFYNGLIEYHAETLKNSKNELISNDRRTKEDIIKSYDHSIDTFLVITALYCDQHISFSNIPGKNDFFDLGHLTYLDNVNKIIITDDKLLHKLLNSSFSNMVMTTRDFLKKNSI